MLSDLYYSIDIYREQVETGDTQPWDINGNRQDNWKFDHTEQGFIQPRSGTNTQINQRQTALSDHVLYTYPEGVDILVGDRISFGTLVYRADFIQGHGIGGIYDHQEIDLSVLDDLDYSSDLS